MSAETTKPRSAGAVLHSPLLYDAVVWLALRGRERRFRERLIELSRLRPGERVLDVGCGTGSLAILAKEAAGATGSVCGVDPSPEMIARARAKAAKARAGIRFENGAAQALPFGQSSFDLALGTLMLHHLDRAARRDLASELRRVLRPGGRVLLVDFARPEIRRRQAAHLRHRHGYVGLAEMLELLRGAGFHRLESGAVGVRNLNFVLAASPEGAATCVAQGRPPA